MFSKIIHNSIYGTYVQRCLLLVSFFLPLAIYAFSVISYGISHYPEIGHQFSLPVTKKLRILLGVSVLIWIFIASTAYTLHKQGRDNRTLLRWSMLFSDTVLSVSLYAAGSLSSPLTILLAAGVGLITLLLPSRQALLHLAYLLGLFFILVLAVQLQWLPYSPLVIDSPDAQTGIDWFWVFSIGVITMYALVIIMMIIYLTINEERELREKLSEQANTDALTGLANRRSLMNHLGRFYDESDDSQSLFSCIIIDIDHFKSINDHWGHIAGDHAIKYVADTLSANLRTSDMLGRYGGEEFVILLPRTSLEASKRVAERCISSIRESAFSYHDEKIAITISAGIASSEHNQGNDPLNLLKLADDALYQAKQQGRDRWIATPDNQTKLQALDKEPSITAKIA